MSPAAATSNNPFEAQVASTIDQQVQHLNETEALAYLSRLIRAQSSTRSGAEADITYAVYKVGYEGLWKNGFNSFEEWKESLGVVDIEQITSKGKSTLERVRGAATTVYHQWAVHLQDFAENPSKDLSIALASFARTCPDVNVARQHIEVCRRQRCLADREDGLRGVPRTERLLPADVKKAVKDYQAATSTKRLSSSANATNQPAGLKAKKPRLGKEDLTYGSHHHITPTQELQTSQNIEPSINNATQDGLGALRQASPQHSNRGSGTSGSSLEFGRCGPNLSPFALEGFESWNDSNSFSPPSTLEYNPPILTGSDDLDVEIDVEACHRTSSFELEENGDLSMNANTHEDHENEDLEVSLMNPQSQARGIKALLGGKAIDDDILMAVLNIRTMDGCVTLHPATLDPEWRKWSPPRASRRQQAKDAAMILIPFHHKAELHWSLFLTRTSCRTLEHFDSVWSHQRTMAALAVVKTHLDWLFGEELRWQFVQLQVA